MIDTMLKISLIGLNVKYTKNKTNEQLIDEFNKTHYKFYTYYCKISCNIIRRILTNRLYYGEVKYIKCAFNSIIDTTTKSINDKSEYSNIKNLKQCSIKSFINSPYDF